MSKFTIKQATVFLFAFGLGSAITLNRATISVELNNTAHTLSYSQAPLTTQIAPDTPPRKSKIKTVKSPNRR